MSSHSTYSYGSDVGGNDDVGFSSHESGSPAPDIWPPPFPVPGARPQSRAHTPVNAVVNQFYNRTVFTGALPAQGMSPTRSDTPETGDVFLRHGGARRAPTPLPHFRVGLSSSSGSDTPSASSFGDIAPRRARTPRARTPLPCSAIEPHSDPYTSMLAFVLPRAVQASADGDREQGLCFPDGNFVIVSKDHQVSRVHKSTLELQAPQIVRQSRSWNEVYRYALLKNADGAHVDAFLRAAFCPEYFPAPPQQVAFKVIRMVLTMAHELGAIPLRRRALTHLEALAKSALDSPSHWANVATKLFVVSCSREVGALWLMPSIMYTLTCVSPRSFDVAAPADHEYIYVLSDEDHRTIANARVSTRNFGEIKALVFANTRCVDRACINSRNRLLDVIHDRYEKDPLHAMHTLSYILQPDAKEACRICSHCYDVVKPKVDTLEDKFLEDLPTHFAFPTWDALEHMREQDMGCPGQILRPVWKHIHKV
ncbi:uncharacterized protein SCHCODRAFT_02748293 [Schizophyllum commune H4-8]|nr:uncharacterized protein SCHCODRAFT_02748293 [Schizophyllum commune H4-8]KAI5891927.1 hypothetical protein SCHCODRAFT_02748293 [Schizophyllum commune H4-8]